MKSLSLALFFILGSQIFGIAQEVKVTGQIKDDESKEAIPFCKVVALTPSDSIVQGAYTDDNGFFSLPLNPGVYKIVMSTYGYLNDTINTGLIRQENFLGVNKLIKDAQLIDEVNVEASSRIEILDRDVQVITDQHKEGAPATKNVLDRLPGISYDEYSGTLKVDGDANIMILVNGVEKDQEYIRNLDPEKLLRVETLRDPGGRYGLEGYSAIINVILRNDYEGTEVFARHMSLADIDYTPFSMAYMVGQIGFTFNYTKNNLNLYAGARGHRNNFKVYNTATTSYENGYRIEETPNSNDYNLEILEYDLTYTLGFDYRINPKHTISFETNTKLFPRSANNTKVDTYTEVFQDDNLIENYGFNSDTKSDKFSTYNTLFYLAELNNQNRLNTNFTYSYYEDDYSTSTLQETYYDRFERGENRKHYTRLYVEFEHDFSKTFSWQTGYGNTWRESKNKFDFIQSDLSTSESFGASSNYYLTDTRHKLYTNMSWKFGSRWGMRLGIAGETSSPRTEGQKLDYLITQPLFDLRFAANKKLNLKLKYRTASQYPQLNEINPFTSQVNPRVTSTGNPFLRPSTTHQFSLRMNAWQGALSVEPYMHYSNNRITQIGELGADSVFNYRFENAQLFQRNGIELNFSYYFPISIMVQGYLDLFQTRIVSSSKDNSLMDWRAQLDVMYVFKKSQAVVGLNYQRHMSKHITGLGYERGEVDLWLLFYQQPLFKKRGSIMFGYFLPIDFGVGYNQDSRVQADGFTLQNNVDVSLIKNMFMVEFSFRFNKGKAVKKTRKDVEMEEENGGGGVF